MKYLKYLLLTLLCCVDIKAQQPDPLLAPDYLGQKHWVDSLYKSITLEEKIGQLFFPMVFSNRDSTHLKKTLKLVKSNKIGGIIFSKGSTNSQIDWSNIFQSYAKIPLLISMDV